MSIVLGLITLFLLYKLFCELANALRDERVGRALMVLMFSVFIPVVLGFVFVFGGIS